MLKYLEVKVPSYWVNALNFIIFDVALISFLYYLTGDVMGRLNDSTFRDGEPHRLFIACPPILGGGLCSTNRFRAFVLLSARFLGLGLVLMTNMTIKGENRVELFTAEDRVLAHGNISRYDEESFEKAVLLRSGCQGVASTNEGSVIYYGELRGDNWSTCVTDRRLLTGTVVEFGAQLVSRNLTTGEPCKGWRRTVNYGEFKGNGFIEFVCPKATMMCVMFPNSIDPNFETCRGLVEHKNETYIFEEGTAWPEMGVEPIQGRLVRGVHFRSREWLDAISITPSAGMKDAIDAMYAAGVERRNVLRKRNMAWTLVSPLWLVAFGIKFALVGVLILTSVALRRANLRTVAHDEHELANLLITELIQNNRNVALNAEASIFLNAIYDKGTLEVYADMYPRLPVTAAAWESGDGMWRHQEIFEEYS